MIFILGGKGFVGSAFARVCAEQGRDFQVIDIDNYDEMIGQECDLFINANGNSKKFMAQRDPLWEFDATVRSVRASLVNFKYKRYVHLSTCDVYPDCSTPETTIETTPVNVAEQSPYGFHKYLAELCVQHAAPDCLVIRMGGFVGPGLRKNPIYDILNGGPLWLDPASELQFIHTEASAAIILQMTDAGVTGQVLNVCGRSVIALQEVIDFVGREVPIQPNSPHVRYEVNIERVMRYAEVPETRPTVLEFVRRSLEDVSQ